MAIFDTLPSVNKCCMCINLKWGTIIIAILGIFSFGLGAVGPLTHRCTTDLHGGFGKIISIFGYIVIVVQFILLIASILLIAGIIMGKPITATWFMYAASFAAIILLVSGILLIVNSFLNSHCPFPLFEIIFDIISFLIWIHFIAVVKSYQSEM